MNASKSARHVDPVDERPSPAGPHDKPELTNPELTPGAGTLSDRTKKDGDVDPGAG